VTTETLISDLKDVSLAEAARLLGLSLPSLKAVWAEIPTAYRTQGGQYRVSVRGLKAWQDARSAK
jgi:hypothetical protein